MHALFLILFDLLLTILLKLVKWTSTMFPLGQKETLLGESQDSKQNYVMKSHQAGFLFALGETFAQYLSRFTW